MSESDRFEIPQDALEAFIERWAKSGASERANYALFLTGLCKLLDLPEPNPSGGSSDGGDYVLERAVTFTHNDGSTTIGRIDLYRRDCFVLEAKQGVDPESGQDDLFGGKAKARSKGHGVRGSLTWAQAMEAAKAQAERYAKALPVAEGWPPFIVVTDVGHSIALYADFSGSGKAYVPFPDLRTHRILLSDLANPAIAARLRQVWLDPLSLDPTRKSAEVTRAVADKLGTLARSLERDGHAPDRVAQFLTRCLFTMFAEDIGLLPQDGFTGLLREIAATPEKFPALASALWRDMDKGGFSAVLRENVKRFNGGLFERDDAIALNQAQFDLLLDAAESDWKNVEPSIFGTLLERALDPRERHKLGAHYTPRAYVERLVLPTIVEPLREEFAAVRAAALQYESDGKNKEARDELHRFHRALCETRVLDPACGSGNFLYVAMEHMKRLEGEVLAALEDLGEDQAHLELQGHTVDPHQFLGLKINPRAAAVADVVLWIGWVQWHVRTKGKADSIADPVLKKYANIDCRDAVLEYDRRDIVRDDDGKPVSRWDGVTTKPHPATGKEVPDETARMEVYKYVNPRPAMWPKADYIVGNPPFVGGGQMRAALGSGYVDALRHTYGDIGESSDYVMYWWDRSAHLVRSQEVVRFGLITTNSLSQTFNRRVAQEHMRSAKNPLSLLFALPDHPWVDSSDGADVRIAMTVGTGGAFLGTLMTIAREEKGADGHRNVLLAARRGHIHSNLKIGADLTGAVALEGNGQISSPGMKLHGAGFLLDEENAKRLSRYDRIPATWPPNDYLISPYRNGKDLTTRPRGMFVIDLYRVHWEPSFKDRSNFDKVDEGDIRAVYPDLYQWLVERVKPGRQARQGQTKDSDEYAKYWWLFGKARPYLRAALRDLDRYIVTVETSKHRFFQFLDAEIVPDNMLIVVASDDAYPLGVLSSKVHECWSLATGGRLGVGNDPRYNKSRCFETFPFPIVDEAGKRRIRELGEQLDAHRKARQALHSDLTMTGMYNVLEKLRDGTALTDKEKDIHEKGLVSVLKQLHDDLDAAVFDAYGWPHDLSDDAILERLVALNAERAAEERRGLVRWLRPEYQNPSGKVAAAQEEMAVAAAPKAAKAKKQPWPSGLPEQVQGVRTALAGHGGPAAVADIAGAFSRAKKDRVAELLETLAALGQAQKLEDGRYVA